MSSQDILGHRRAIRHFNPIKPLDTAHVRHCLELATLALTNSNMQLWGCYHATRPKTLKKPTRALLDQQTIETARQVVVFITRRDKHQTHAKTVKAFEIENVMQNSPEEKQTKRIKKWRVYYDFVMPLFYIHFFWLLGLSRRSLAQIIGLFRPIVEQATEDGMRITVRKSCTPVAQTSMLAMSERGYDICPVEGFDSWLVKKTLGLPYHTKINMVITCGVCLPDGVRPERCRLPSEQVYHQV